MKRFYKAAATEPREDGFAIALDGRPMRTPAQAPLVVPGRALAEAVAAEWQAQGDEIRPHEMPLTRAANSAIDRVGPEHGAVAAMVAGYGETDLICYRATHPEALAAQQAAAWDPLIDWAGAALGAALTRSAGVMPVAQPPESLARLRAAVEAHDPWRLTALHELVVLSGSLVIGLAISHGWVEAEEGWSLGRIDEDWNIAQWGEDDEAAAQAARRKRDFLAAARLLDLVRG